MRRSMLYAEAVPVVPPPPPHVREYCSTCPIRLLRTTLTVVVGTCGTLLLRTEKSNANPCLSYLSDHIRYQRFGIIQHQSPGCHNPISCQPNYIFLSLQTVLPSSSVLPLCCRRRTVTQSRMDAIAVVCMTVPQQIKAWKNYLAAAAPSSIH